MNSNHFLLLCVEANELDAVFCVSGVFLIHDHFDMTPLLGGIPKLKILNVERPQLLSIPTLRALCLAHEHASKQQLSHQYFK